MPGAGEPAVFCRPVVTAPAVIRRDGTVLADAWLPDLVGWASWRPVSATGRSRHSHT